MSLGKEYEVAPATLVIKARPEAVKQVRDFVGMVFGAWGLDDHVARTVASELATNAIQHGSRCGDPVVVRVFRREDGCVVVEAWDCSDLRPVVRPPDLGAEGGRGLQLLEALVSRWGTRPLDGRGKVVFAELEPVARDEII
ncbi:MULTISPECIES: ATP-binding protein [Thermomonosporaceae]|uniref:ATP-binding protein n=1 Tax=Thermomonosporaceae TaxID=2012 RepID=UPI00255B389B|nr:MULTISPECIES: ATP-binding protein [Thermomonosporaceae]MDL4772554.1 ATP-binding protein [Actinomadura xylanilytica]